MNRTLISKSDGTKSNLVSIGHQITAYDSAALFGTLTVEFANGVYEFRGVPVLVYMEILQSDSPGSTFHKLVRRGPYEWRKLDQDEV